MGRLLCLRDGKTRILRNVSYSEDGLKYTTDEKGRNVYFVNPQMKIENNKVILSGIKREDNRIIPYEPFDLDKDRLTRQIKKANPTLSEFKLRNKVDKIYNDFYKAENEGRKKAEMLMYEVE